MNIDSIKNYSPAADYMLKQKHDNMNYSERGIKYGNKNKGYYGGSFTGASKTAAYSLNGVIDKVYNTNTFDKLLDFANAKAAVTLSFVSLIVAGVLRPITNLAMASKDDWVDSIHAASHAIASAGIGYIVSSAVMKPFDDGFKKFASNIKERLNDLEDLFGVDKISSRKLAKSGNYKKLTKIAQMGIDTVLLGIPKAMLTIALIPPILKYVFHIEKGKKADKNQNIDDKNNAQHISFAKSITPSMKDLIGGTK